MSLDFLVPDAGASAPPAESPMASATAAAGATFEVRDGWRVPVRFASPQAEALARDEAVAWTDASHLRKTEIHGPLAALAGGLDLGRAALTRETWWCPISPSRCLVLGPLPDELDGGIRTVDVTAQFAALRIAGPAARETIARFCALDLRPSVTPPGDFRPGSVARTPGSILCEAPDAYLLLVGAALAEYLWTVVSDAGTRLGGRPVGVDALAPAGALREETGSHA